MFTARRFDPESDTYYYRARTYYPVIGRFLQPDPIGYADGMNMYTYCGNNPVNYVDPWGLKSYLIFYGQDSEGGFEHVAKYFKENIQSNPKYCSGKDEAPIIL